MQEVKTKKAKKSFFLRLAVFVFICYVAVMLVNQRESVCLLILQGIDV